MGGVRWQTSAQEPSLKTVEVDNLSLTVVLDSINSI